MSQRGEYAEAKTELVAVDGDLGVATENTAKTRLLYERNMRTLVLPFFKEVTLREIGVARCDYFLKQLAKKSYNRARQARVVLRLALSLAVRNEIIPRNPMDHVSRLRRPARTPDVFTWDELKAIRTGISAWEQRPISGGPKPDGQLGQIVEVMLGTSARIGELLAIRLRDLDLDAPIPSVRISGTIVSRKGAPTHRQDHPKTARSVRRVALPGFALRAIKARLKKIRFTHPDALLFATRVGTPHTTNNVRRQLRDVMDKAGVADVTPHRFRRTAATAINEIGGLQLASELLGHSDPSITREHYIRRNETVNPITAEFLEQAFGKAG
ncbi:tyrosine recombinase XerC [Leucobacter tardus]|uniref:Site-specific integrase n=1 Tax=Leucobacter tardus TaxID=501483 RepID=A0A939TNY3_9MICO|nr:site-specific integrase [Leucobacter tardus]MBO2990704.1 site-specific integrase [Leucobacter tardus]